MLSLFKETEQIVRSEDALFRAREILISFLNKGVIPNWEQFYQDLPLLTSAEDLDNIRTYFFKLTEWNFLEEILKESATEYFFHSATGGQFLKVDGEKGSFSLNLEEKDWQLWLEILSLKYKQNWNVQHPFCSFYGELWEKSYRFSLIHGCTSPLETSKLILRCLKKSAHTLSAFGKTELLKEGVEQKKTILIAGSTGSGKTSLLTTLLEHVERNEHLVILEDTYEILSGHPHQTRFLSGDSPQTSLKSFLSYSLRLSPDRIILGEMRSHEVVPFIMAMNTGHKGLMGTIHASSATDAINRVALLFSLYSGEASLSFEKVIELICRNLEYVVYMENKKVKEIIKILGAERGVAFYETIEGDNNINLF